MIDATKATNKNPNSYQGSVSIKNYSFQNCFRRFRDEIPYTRVEPDDERNFPKMLGDFRQITAFCNLTNLFIILSVSKK